MRLRKYNGLWFKAKTFVEMDCEKMYRWFRDYEPEVEEVRVQIRTLEISIGVNNIEFIAGPDLAMILLSKFVQSFATKSEAGQ